MHSLNSSSQPTTRVVIHIHNRCIHLYIDIRVLYMYLCTVCAIDHQSSDITRFKRPYCIMYTVQILISNIYCKDVGLCQNITSSCFHQGMAIIRYVHFYATVSIPFATCYWKCLISVYTHHDASPTRCFENTTLNCGCVAWVETYHTPQFSTKRFVCRISLDTLASHFLKTRTSISRLAPGL